MGRGFHDLNVYHKDTKGTKGTTNASVFVVPLCALSGRGFISGRGFNGIATKPGMGLHPL